MNILQSISIASVITASSLAFAGPVVELSPSQIHEGLSGIKNTEFSELIGVSVADEYTDFAIYGDDQNVLYEGTFMTRIVRSFATGNLHFNYRIMDANGDLNGRISQVDVTGFADFQTRVEYRNEITSPGAQGPFMAARSELGDVLSFGFEGGLNTADESRFFFAMLDTDTFYDDAAMATITLETGESVSFVVDGAVPTPGSLALLGGAALLTSRRRR